MAQAKKVMKQKGIRWDTWDEETDKPNRITAYQIMLWSRTNGRWSGTWMWAGNKETARKLADKARTCAIAEWKATETPAEVFLHIIECFVGGPIPDKHAYDKADKANDWEQWDAWNTRDVVGLTNLSLVCRAWYTRIAPLLYSKLWLHDEDIGDFCSALRTSGEFIRSYARHIVVSGRHPWEISSRVGRHLPNAVALTWNARGTLPVTTRHPFVYRAIAHAHSTFRNVVSLLVREHLFQSTSELFQLLCAFPSLTQHLEGHFGCDRVSILSHVGVDVPRYGSTL